MRYVNIKYMYKPLHSLTTENLVLTARMALVSQLGFSIFYYFLNVFHGTSSSNIHTKSSHQPCETGVIISVLHI